MSTRHIVSAFDQELESIQTAILKMGGLVEVSISESIQALEDRDIEKAAQVRKADRQIDSLERLIIHDAAQLIALRSPAAVDLRLVLSAMKTASNLERIGDYAKNIAKRSQMMAELEGKTQGLPSLRRMAREVQTMLNDTLEAFVQRDAQLAAAVIERDLEVDQMYNSLFREFLTFMLEDPRNISTCMHLHFIAKNIERMGDHVTAVCEQVIYFVEGKFPGDDREKAELTAKHMPEL